MKFTGRNVFLLICGFILLPLSDSLASSDSLYTGFTSELNTKRFIVSGLMAPRPTLWNLHSRLTSEALVRESPDYDNQWKTELRFDLDADHRINQKLNFRFDSFFENYRDQEVMRHVELGQSSPWPGGYDPQQAVSRSTRGRDEEIFRLYSRVGADAKVTNDLDISVMGGSAWDKQIGGSGNGLSSRAGFTWDTREKEALQLSGDGWIDRFSNRQNHEGALRGRIFRMIGEAENQLFVQWRNNRADIFQSDSGSVSRRIQDELNIANQLSWIFFPGSKAEYQLNYKKSSVDYKGSALSSSRESRFENHFALLFRKPVTQARFYYSYNIEDDDWGRGIILGRRQTLGLDASQMFGSDSLGFNYHTEKITRDTPDKTDSEDKDELNHHIQLTFQKWMTKRAYMLLYALTTLNHEVYLNASKSADNRWKRVFLLRPGVVWIPSDQVRNRSAFELSTYYTDYDFDTSESGTGLKSRVFRKWAATDTLIFSTGGWTKIILAAKYQLEDLGRLNWGAFIQELSEEATEVNYSIWIERSLWTHLNIRTGFLYKRRDENGFGSNLIDSNETVRLRKYISNGPVIQIMTMGAGRFNLSVRGTFLNVVDSNRDNNYRNDTFSLSFRYLI